MGLLKNKKIILNIDESWISQMDYRRMKWCAPGSTNSVPTKQVQPRISLIVAIDSVGHMYASFTQVNTDSKIMGLYIRELAKLLDAEMPGWRAYLVWSHDGARYFNCSAIKAVLKSLNVPTMVSAPHSYNVAPSELVFASVKAVNLNLERLPTGKTHFLNVVNLVLARLKDLKPS